MKYFYISIILTIQLSLGLMAQSIKVEGHVKDIDGNTLPGITVSVYGTQLGASSDIDGYYNLQVPEGEITFLVRGVGYKEIKKPVAVTGESMVLDFALQEDVLGLDEVVVSATRTELNRKEAPVLVSVTGKKQLAAVRATTLMEGLVFQPGLRPEVNCQNCNYSQVRINGLEGAYSQILINSRPIFGSLNGVYGLEQIPTNMIDRIEVIRGGGSALFGSNAIAGTINVITKNPIKNEGQAAITYNLIGGEAKDIVSTFNGSLVSDDYDRGISFYGLHRKRDSYDANDDDLSELTRLININTGAKFFNNFSDRKNIVGEINVSNENRRGGNKFDLPEHDSDIAESIRTDVVGGNLTYDYYTKLYKNKFSVFASGQKTKANNYYGGGGDLLGYGVTREDTWLLGGQHTAYIPVKGGKVEWSSGVEYRYNDLSEKRLNPNINPVNQDQKVIGLYTQGDWRINEHFKILAGLRLDNINSDLLDESITAINPRASLLYNITEVLIMRGSYAKGFRAPLFYSEDVHNELIGAETRRVQLADDLKKETSDTFSASFEYNHSHDTHQLVFMLEGFYTNLKDRFNYVEIDDADDDGFYIKEKRNVEGAVVKGVNVEFKYSPNRKFLMQLGATVQSARFSEKVPIYEEEKTGKEITSDKIFRTPDVYGNLTATYKPQEEWAINLTGVYTGAMDIYHEGVNEIKRTEGMFEFGLNTAYDISTSQFFDTQVSLGVKNIFDQYQDDFDKGPDRDPTYIYGPQLPRTVFVGLKIKY